MRQERPDRLPNAFWRHFAASATSNLGDGMIAAAAPLLALSLTDDPRLISAVAFASMLPWLVLSLPAGVYIDRWNRRSILIVSNSIRAGLFLLIAVLIVADALTIEILVAIVFVLAVGEVFFDMTAQAFLPSIVASSLLERANGRLYAAEVAANSFIGLPVGAWLFVVTAAAPFGVQSAALAIAAALLGTIRVDTIPSGRSSPNFGNPFRDIQDGARWLWRQPLLRMLALMLGAANMCHMFAQSVYAKFVRDELGLGPRGFGLLLATSAVGSIGGGVIGARVARRLGATTAIAVAYVMFAALEFVPWAFPNVAAVITAGVLMAVFGTIWNVLTVSLRQRLIPSELFGRVNSMYRFLGTGTSAIGAIIGGQIAYHFGLRATYLASGVTLSIILIVGAPRLIRYSQTYIAPDRTPAPPSIT